MLLGPWSLITGARVLYITLVFQGTLQQIFHVTSREDGVPHASKSRTLVASESNKSLPAVMRFNPDRTIPSMSRDITKKDDDKMFAVAPMPIFTSRTAWDYRPAVPSALSSSPIRTAPLSPVDENSLPRRDVNSSPIPPSKSKFASRPIRTNPVLKRREDARENRRKLFLQNVRQRADDRAWERRDVENTVGS
jgi:hypothetical protein